MTFDRRLGECIGNARITSTKANHAQRRAAQQPREEEAQEVSPARRTAESGTAEPAVEEIRRKRTLHFITTSLSASAQFASTSRFDSAPLPGNVAMRAIYPGFPYVLPRRRPGESLSR